MFIDLGKACLNVDGLKVIIKLKQQDDWFLQFRYEDGQYFNIPFDTEEVRNHFYNSILKSLGIVYGKGDGS